MHPCDYFNEEISLNDSEQKIIDDFHKLYFSKLEKQSGLQLSWLGHLTGKLPSDLWRYQEIIYEYKPDLIIECGTHWGGSAVYLANIMDLVGHGQILSIDLYPKSPLPNHSRISYLQGDSTNPKIVSEVSNVASDHEKIMVILDSDHHANHVYAELQSYHPLVPSGGYLIVEDTFLGGNPSHDSYGEGPIKATYRFLSEQKDFYIEKKNERFLFTLNRNGFLRRA